jgi:hypothetical protein
MDGSPGPDSHPAARSPMNCQLVSNGVVVVEGNGGPFGATRPSGPRRRLPTNRPPGRPNQPPTALPTTNRFSTDFPTAATTTTTPTTPGSMLTRRPPPNRRPAAGSSPSASALAAPLSSAPAHGPRPWPALARPATRSGRTARTAAGCTRTRLRRVRRRRARRRRRPGTPPRAPWTPRAGVPRVVPRVRRAAGAGR